jgi:hypothetical protein
MIENHSVQSRVRRYALSCSSLFRINQNYFNVFRSLMAEAAGLALAVVGTADLCFK